METITIAICDDNPGAIAELKTHIEEYVRGKVLSIKIECFRSGSCLLDSPCEPDILFLDIEMPQKDGIETARLLRERKVDCRIIMATGRAERFKEGYYVGAVRFVTKPFCRDEIREALEHTLGTFVGMEIIELYEKRNTYRIEQNQIQYLKAFDSYAEAVVGVEGRVMRTEDPLSILEEKLEPRIFCRISRSHIVNFQYVTSCDKGIIFIRGEKLPVSRRRRKEVEKSYRRYDLYYRG